jgi:uncharacterized membrane protein
VLTIWLLTMAYGFVDSRIGQPINAGLRELVIRFTDWPVAEDDDYAEVFDKLPVRLKDKWTTLEEELQKTAGGFLPSLAAKAGRLTWMKGLPEAQLLARRAAFERWWVSYSIGGWPVLNVIGLIIAIILVYFIGAFLSRSIGNRLWRIGEGFIQRVPLVGRVYPAFKQITDFVFGDGSDESFKFNRVVAVQYPRKGIWSVGLVTGNTMRTIEGSAGVPCLTVFVPSSPTPFTGYVITVPVEDTLDLPVTIEDALKFAVSGGVVVPPSQTIAELRQAGSLPKAGPAGQVVRIEPVRNGADGGSETNQMG